MSDVKKDEPKKGAWVKTILGTTGGLLSGAVVMWLSPLLDKAVRPAKPVANFAVQTDGLSVSFLNRSAGGTQGRWDFGDSSALEFVKADQAEVTHTFPKPGTYVVKLVVTNILNEENERSITVDVGSPPSKPGPVEKPQVVDLRVKPPGKVGEPVFAPATFQFQATVDNAEHFVWDFGDGKGIQLADFAVAHTYDVPGTYNVKLAAFNGKEKAVEEATIRVLPPPVGALSLTLRVQDEGVEVIEQRRMHKASKTVRVGKKGPETLELSIPTTTGFEITQVEKKNSQNDNLQKTEWKIANDRKFVKVVAQLPKLNVPYDAVLNEQLVIVEQRRQPTNREPVPLTNVVATPGSTTLRLPPVPFEWADVQRHVAYELRDGDRIVWQGDRAPQDVAITVRGKPYHFTATITADRVEVSVQ